MAEICAPPGFLPAVPAAAVLAADFGAAVSVAAAAGADSVFGAAGADSAFGSAGAATASTALLQLDERLDMFCCRHCSDAAPPGGMLEQ